MRPGFSPLWAKPLEKFLGVNFPVCAELHRHIGFQMNPLHEPWGTLPSDRCQHGIRAQRRSVLFEIKAPKGGDFKRKPVDSLDSGCTQALGPVVLLLDKNSQRIGQSLNTESEATRLVSCLPEA